MISSQVVPTGLAATADYPPGATWGPFAMRDYEFVWLLRGSAEWSALRPDDAETARGSLLDTLRPGTLALSRPGDHAHFTWDRRRRTTHAYLHFRVTSPGGLPPDTAWPRRRELVEPLLGLCRYLLDLAAVGGDVAPDRTADVATLLLDLFVLGPLPDRRTPVVPPVLEAVVDYVRRSWASAGPRRIPLAELAAGAGISSGHLSRVFAREYGTSPAAAFELLRLARAASILRRSNLTLQQTATETGFANPYHFSRRFALAYRIPPGRFRATSGQDSLGPLADAGLLQLWSALNHRVAR